MTGGVRYSDEQKDIHGTGGMYQLGTAILANPDSFYDFVDRATYDAWTPKASIQFQASPETFVYFSATRGFKSGGLNSTAMAPGGAFQPEFAWSYEGGLKRTMADGRVYVNTAVFYNDYKDLQVQTFVGPGLIQVSNAASATISGLELEATAAVGRSLHLASHVSWLDATYDRYLFPGPGGVTFDTAGNRLNNAPEWSGSISAVYQLATGGAGTASVRSDVSWQSRVFFTPVNDAIETQRAYGLLRLRAGFEPKNRRWEVAVYVRNLANQGYITGTANVPPTAIDRPPRRPPPVGHPVHAAPLTRRASRVSIVFARRTHSKRRPRTVAQTVEVRFPFVSKNFTSVVPASSSRLVPSSNVFAILCVAAQAPAGLNRNTMVTAVNSWPPAFSQVPRPVVRSAGLPPVVTFVTVPPCANVTRDWKFDTGAPVWQSSALTCKTHAPWIPLARALVRSCAAG